MIVNTFHEHQLTPNIVLTATDAEVIKSYVNTGIGIAIIQEMAFEKDLDIHLSKRSVDHLFTISHTNILINKSLEVICMILLNSSITNGQSLK